MTRSKLLAEETRRSRLGVAPLAVATGAGAEMRQSLGTAVLFGMLGVTCFGLIFTPAVYTSIRQLRPRDHKGALSEGGCNVDAPRHQATKSHCSASRRAAGTRTA